MSDLIKSITSILFRGSRVLLGSLLFIGQLSAQLTLPDVENPHGSDNCALCHAGSGQPTRANLMPDICESCHSKAAVDAIIHPMYQMDLNSPQIHMPETFPLSQYGYMTCLTCHQVACKVDRANRTFLRGAPYRRDLDFCFQCHKSSNFKKTDPHQQVRADGSIDHSACLHCHVRQPTREDHPTIAREMHLDMTATCNKCHALHTHEQNHQGKDLKTSRKATLRRYRQTQRDLKVELPLSEENLIQCNTCHYTHQRGTLAADQVVYAGAGENQKYLRLAKEKLCYACHDL